MDQISTFIDAMRASDCGPASDVEIIADDTFRRYRIDGDKPRTQNGSYVLRVDGDGFAVGGFQSFRDQVWHAWHSRAPRKTTPEDREARKARLAEARERQDAARAAEAAEAARKASIVWREAAKSGSSDYLARKGIADVSEVHCRLSRGDVVVPMWRDGKIVGAQFIRPDGSKRFVAGTAKTGAYHAIPGAGTDRIVVAEGLATGWAVWKSTGDTVAIAFDAGNLRAVVDALRSKYPDAVMIVAADHDAWTMQAGKKPAGYDDPPGDDPRWEEWRQAGICVNTGREKAMAIPGVYVIHPPIPHDDPGKRTDFWDVYSTDGPAAIVAAFEDQMRPPEPHDEMGDNWEPDYGPPPDYEEIGGNDQSGLEIIRPMGYNGDQYYFLPRSTGQVTAMTATALGHSLNLERLAPRSFWESRFGGGDVSERKLANAAGAAMIQACHMVGIYNPDRVRGIGAWLEKGECVFNSGEHLITPSGTIPSCDYLSPTGHLYPLSVSVIADLPHQMEDREAFEIVRLATVLNWADPISGYYLVGWIVTSILGGVMQWRPHAYLTGDRGAGKSTIIERLIKPLLGTLAIEADGGSTEAGIRHAILNSSRPVIMDEAEGNSRTDRDKMASVMNLIRASSSGGKVINANEEFRCRASFLLAGINPQIRTEADKSRIVVIHLRNDDRHDARERYSDFRTRLSRLTRGDAAGRLISRLIGCAQHLGETLDRISTALHKIGASARFADQHAALLAGVWLLVKRRAPTDEEAGEFIAKVGMTADQSAARDEVSGENYKVLSELMTSEVNYDADGVSRRSTVAGMIETVRRGENGAPAATSGLSDLGIAVVGDMVRIAKSSPRIARLLRDTPWSGDGWGRHLASLPGAEDGARAAFRGLTRRRCVDVPIALILDGCEPSEVDLPLEDWA